MMWDVKACIYLFKKSGKSKIPFFLLNSDLCDAFQMKSQINVMRKIYFVGACAFLWCVCMRKTKYEFKMERLLKFNLFETVFTLKKASTQHYVDQLF